ncbi:MAG: hypothetical protein WAX89_06525 [Alphaproteobacteria bacterium]
MKFIFFLCLLLLTAPVQAAQTRFERTYTGKNVSLTYHWRDTQGRNNSLLFQLPKAEVARGNAEFKPFNQVNTQATQEAFAAVEAFIQPYVGKQKKIDLTAHSNGFRATYYGFKTPEQQELDAKVRATYQEQFDKTITNNFYMSYGNYVMPDHRRIAKRYVPAVSPIASAIAAQTKGQGLRGVVDYTLSFLQTIPYDELVSRQSSNGAGFQTPYGLLLNNRGDCDTKSVALAAILRKLYPSQRIVIVYVPEHAFVGIHATPSRTDYALRLGGEPFILADPTGPHQTRWGVIETTAEAHLKRGSYSFQEVPF